MLMNDCLQPNNLQNYKKNARTQYARAHIDVELQKWSKNLLIVTL